MITCIHGFLGRPRDWDFLRDAGLEIEAIDLEAARKLASSGDDRSHDTLLGYSMGGRLALESLAGGARFGRAIIVSAGLNLEEGRDERRLRDERWARRFESDRWDDLMRDWNAQPVFGGHEIAREECEYSRAELAAALRDYSPGVLAPLAPRLRAISIPLLWIAGERDATYVEVARRATSILPNAALWICPDAGHRVPWEQPDRFVDRIRQFVDG